MAYYPDELTIIHHGDCIEVLPELGASSVDAVVTDPPYALSFMGKNWDSMHPNPAIWRECLRVLKPGGHLLSFGGTRTWHRLCCDIEDAGFEIRDSIAWLYGSGFPKSLDVGKTIDKAERGVPQGGSDPTSPNHGKYRTSKTEGKRWDGDIGQSYGAGGSAFLADGMGNGSVTDHAESGDAETVSDAAKQWQGWGTALKPAFEPIIMARKPLSGTVAANVAKYGTGALNVDACRVGIGGQLKWSTPRDMGYHGGTDSAGEAISNPSGRWPPNVLLDDTQAAELDKQTQALKQGGAIKPNSKGSGPRANEVFGVDARDRGDWQPYEDSGGASRFFPVFRYQAKAPTKERPKVDGIAHPTVKPLGLMRWLVKLVTPIGGLVLDPFAGSGATVEACLLENIRCIAIEKEDDYLPLIMQRLERMDRVA